MEFLNGVLAMSETIVPLAAVAFAIFWALCYHRVPAGHALVRIGFGGTRVEFSGMVVFPLLHHAELIDTTVKQLEISLIDAKALVCKDNIQANFTASFFLRVNNRSEDILRVATTIGAWRAADVPVMSQLFAAKFTEVLQTASGQLDFAELNSDREAFKQLVLETMPGDLGGYALDGLAIEYLERTTPDT